jgi:hypothetical protein
VSIDAEAASWAGVLASLSADMGQNWAVKVR